MIEIHLNEKVTDQTNKAMDDHLSFSIVSFKQTYSMPNLPLKKKN